MKPAQEDKSETKGNKSFLMPYSYEVESNGEKIPLMTLLRPIHALDVTVRFVNKEKQVLLVMNDAHGPAQYLALDVQTAKRVFNDFSTLIQRFEETPPPSSGE